MSEPFARLKQQFREICSFDDDGVSRVTLDEIERLLGVRLPEDFCAIASFFSGGDLGGISHFDIGHGDNPLNIVDETQRLRQAVALPHRYIVIAEPPVSLVLMDTQSFGSVVWLDAVDVHQLNIGEPLNQPDVWANYAAYFNELLVNEEDY